MSRDDFERCTPFEFYEVHRHWAERQRDGERAAWERTRVLALFEIQPYVKGQADPHKVLPFPWDNEEKAETQREQLSAEELRQRYEAAVKKYGLQQ